MPSFVLLAVRVRPASPSKFKVPLNRIQLYELDASSDTLPVPTISKPDTESNVFAVSVNAAKRFAVANTARGVNNIFFMWVGFVKTNIFIFLTKITVKYF